MSNLTVLITRRPSFRTVGFQGLYFNEDATVILSLCFSDYSLKPIACSVSLNCMHGPHLDQAGAKGPGPRVKICALERVPDSRADASALGTAPRQLSQCLTPFASHCGHQFHYQWADERVAISSHSVRSCSLRTVREREPTMFEAVHFIHTVSRNSGANDLISARWTKLLQC